MKAFITLPILFASLFTLLLSACAAPILVAGGAAGGAAVAHDERNSKTILNDTVIETKAKDTIYKDPEMAKRVHINVTSFNNVVLLTGEALSRSLRDRAINIVRNLENVRRVHNEVRIADLTSFSSRTGDTWITSKVKAKMLATKDFDSSRVKVVTEDSTVFLMGLVSREEGKQAATIASQISGVKRVVKIFEYL